MRQWKAQRSVLTAGPTKTGSIDSTSQPAQAYPSVERTSHSRSIVKQPQATRLERQRGDNGPGVVRKLVVDVSTKQKELKAAERTLPEHHGRYAWDRGMRQGGQLSALEDSESLYQFTSSSGSVAILTSAEAAEAVQAAVDRQLKRK